jgi:hypothetical protein
MHGIPGGVSIKGTGTLSEARIFPGLLGPARAG